MQGYANWGGMVKELGCQIVTQNLDFRTGWTSFIDNANWGKMAHFSPPLHSSFLIPQTAIFCIATEPGKDSSFAAGI